MHKCAELMKYFTGGVLKRQFFYRQGGGIFGNWNSLAPYAKDFPDFYTENF